MKIAFLAAAVLGLTACAPAITWEPPPGAPPQAFSMDDAGCQLTARGVDPSFARRGLVGAFVTGMDQREDYSLCMRSRGYVPVSAAVPTPAAAPPLFAHTAEQGSPGVGAWAPPGDGDR